MRLLLQRVRRAKVETNQGLAGEIGAGLLVLAGFGSEDDAELPSRSAWRKTIDKMLGLRIFPDAQDKMNRSLVDAQGDVLLVSQFTLHADCRKGRRPSFTSAAPPETALELFNRLVQDVSRRAPGKVAMGVFGEIMDVSLTNWGPVTIMLDSNDMG
jgi:D-tyrosyl-tRNA(Tyr) deacylase